MKNQKLTFWLGWMIFTSLYLGLSWWLFDRGFYSLESFFVDYKATVLVRFPEGFLRTFYFTSPTLFFLGSLPFQVFPGLSGSHILNAILIGGLTNHLFFKSLSRSWESKFHIIYLLFSPVILFAGTSGSSLAIFLVLFYLLFYVSFKYTESYSVFHLTLMSLILGLFVLMNMEYLKLILLLIPILFFVAFFKAKGIRGNFYTRASVIFSNTSQRRKFFTGFFSSVLVVAFIPLMSFLIFLIINKIFSGNYFFYEKSLGDSWNSYSVLSPLIDQTNFLWSKIASKNFLFLGSVSLLSLNLIYQVFVNGNKPAKSFLLILVLLFAISEAADSKVLYLNINNLSMLTGAALAAFYFSEKEFIRRAWTYQVLGFLIPIGAVFLEITYFKSSIVQQEQRFFASFSEKNQEEELKSIYQTTASILKEEGGRILADDAIFYPELSLLDKEFTWEGHFSPHYMHALQQPEMYADYALVTKKNHLLHLNDIVATSFKRLDSMKVELPKKVIYEDEFRQLIRIGN